LTRDILSLLARAPAAPQAEPPAGPEPAAPPPSAAPPAVPQPPLPQAQPPPLPTSTSTPAATPPVPPVFEPGQGRYALLVINDKHVDPVFAALAAPLDDTLGLEALLTSQDVGGFKVTTLRNQTSEAVGEAIEAFFRERGPDDVSLLYYYGVAVKDSEWGLQFITQDSQRDEPSTAVEVYNIQGAMRPRKSRRPIVLFDCVFAHAYP